MTARKPVIPAELRELLNVFAELAQLPPQPVPGPGCYAAWRDVRDDRAAQLRVRIRSLVDELSICDQFPGLAAEDLAEYCTRAVERVRKELARPLGYEPEPAKAPA